MSHWATATLHKPCEGGSVMVAPAETESVPIRPGGWTADDVLAFSEDQFPGQRVELVDGALLVSPAPSSGHQRLLHRLQLQLATALPDGAELLPGVNVRLGGKRLLVPDLALVARAGMETSCYDESDLLLAVEIESPSTRLRDRGLKHTLYAEAMVRYYLLVDPDLHAATLFELGTGEYVPIARSESGRIELHRPFETTVDLTG
ncbi:Endonuclease, Uma2 family (restriction endonuclease fold) [Amycolatopsis xylanica]|uniref:Endonuclease, Uma2 family (Restriction endonuclease fold) n=2 Tax=Amycolatopsis xylanica TaxID=589385 RepID=A0A1H3Q909_9PSEU|nr:Endonuclease, Uma2 family (restriction endonuclease fold) [Amycolatopsis xylanica]